MSTSGSSSPLKIVAGFAVPVLVILALGKTLIHPTTNGAGTAAADALAVAERIQPVGLITLKKAAAGPARTGEQVFAAQCAACHKEGALGAPKLGDAGAWGPRVKNGFEALLNSALKGKGNMAAQGGGEFSDYEVARAVVYMANQGGAKFAEPAAPAAAPAQ